ncbi:Alpha/Beta hydrolase protein [Mycena leptocephala]|nr:Alpha/Beta hydrolase protein [Mycena leptocephala]
MSQYAHLSEPDPELAAPLSQMTMPDFGKLVPADVPRLRPLFVSALILQIKERYRPHLPPDSQYAVENYTIAVEGGEICVRAIMPTPIGEESVGFPIMVWFHGGGGILGDLELDDFQLRILCVEHRMCIINVDYRLAPEHKFPTGLEDCYASLKWTVNNAAKIRASFAKGFIVGGSSAGSNLTAAVVHRARDDPFFEKHKITGQVLQIPVLVHPSAYPAEYAADLLSYEQNKDAPIVNKVAMKFFYECLQGPPDHPDLSPLLADHSNLPPAYLQVCGMDPRRDEGLLYARLLSERDIATRVDIYPGVPHGFHQSFPQMSLVNKWDQDFTAGLAWILKSKV